MAYQLAPIAILPGTDLDNTALATKHFVNANGIRFYNSYPQKIGGNQAMIFDNSNTITGAPRTIYSQLIGTTTWTLIGTNTRLYALFATQLTNITPLETSTTPIANSLDTHYTTLANNPFTTVLGSTMVTVAHTAHVLQPGDVITISGAATTNGIPAGNFNASQIVRTTATNSYTIIVATAATSSGTGGGAAVIEKTGIITVNQAAHGYLSGDRVGILAAADTGGILAAQINIEHIIRNVTTNTYDITTTGIATSSVTAGGGAATTVQHQIAAGPVDQSAGIGYGMGRYGVGLYGVAKTSSSLQTLPRIWDFARFGNNVLMTPGQQTGIYQWTGSTATAPTLLMNAPTAVNYVFVSDNIVVAMGAGGVPNRLQWSDQGNETVWSPTAQNQAGQDDVEGADPWVSQINVRGTNLLFTNKTVWTFQYLGLPLVWQTQLLDDVAGIIGQNAVCQHAGIAFWMGNEDFYMYNGGIVQSIPSNDPDTGKNYIRQYAFANLNRGETSKCFAWYNKQYQEVEFHIPTGMSTECDTIFRLSIIDFSWTIDTGAGMPDRTAAESPHIATQYPKMIDINGIMYQHELGVDDNAAPLPFSLTSKMFEGGTNWMEIGGVISNSIQIGDVDLNILTYTYPQQAPLTNTQVTIAADEGKTNFTANGRHWQYQISQEVLGGFWRGGEWRQYLQEGTYE